MSRYVNKHWIPASAGMTMVISDTYSDLSNSVESFPQL